MANIEDGGIPAPLLAQVELGGAKVSIKDAIEHLNAAMTIGLRGAGGEHTARAVEILRHADAEIDRAITFHSGGG